MQTNKCRRRCTNKNAKTKWQLCNLLLKLSGSIVEGAVGTLAVNLCQINKILHRYVAVGSSDRRQDPVGERRSKKNYGG